jgi:hypothetical protein
MFWLLLRQPLTSNPLAFILTPFQFFLALPFRMPIWLTLRNVTLLHEPIFISWLVIIFYVLLITVYESIRAHLHLDELLMGYVVLLVIKHA